MTYVISLLIFSNLLLAAAVMYLNWRINQTHKYRKAILLIGRCLETLARVHDGSIPMSIDETIRRIRSVNRFQLPRIVEAPTYADNSLYFDLEDPTFERN